MAERLASRISVICFELKRFTTQVYLLTIPALLEDDFIPSCKNGIFWYNVENRRRMRKWIVTLSRKDYYRKNPLMIPMAVALAGLTLLLFTFGRSIMETTQATEDPELSLNYQQQFIDSIAGTAQELGMAHDLYPSVIIAQAIQESGYGLSGLGSYPIHNLFGIKGAYEGQSVSLETWEDDGAGNSQTIMAEFRHYPSHRQALEDYVAVLKQDWFSGAWRSNAPTYEDATRALTGVYATDTSYADRLNALIVQHNLTQYDQWVSPEQGEFVGEEALVYNPYRQQYTSQATLDIDQAWASLEGSGEE